MPRLFLIRHAEPVAAWGGADHDPGLSIKGHEQAAATASALMGLGPLALLSSPMRRCQETATPFAALSGQTPVLEPAVSEVVAPAGVSDRRTWLRENFPWDEGGARRKWADVDPGLLAWRDDVTNAMSALRGDSAVFSHFIAINVIVGAATGAEETMVFRPGHASITELALDDGLLRVVSLGAEMQSADVR
jgi:broad specificity phosphatase PhoE